MKRHRTTEKLVDSCSSCVYVRCRACVFSAAHVCALIFWCLFWRGSQHPPRASNNARTAVHVRLLPPSRASSQLEMADASSPRDATSAGDEAALNRLMERAVAADVSARYAFAASLWKRAAAAATVLHGGDTLVTAKCTLEQAGSFCSQASAEASLQTAAALIAEAWTLTSSVLPLLSTRMDNNTLLPGRCTKEEVDFFKRFTRARRENVLSARDLQLVGFSVGQNNTPSRFILLIGCFVN